MAIPTAGSHLQMNKELWLAETFSKMVAPIACSHFQLIEELWLADTDTILEAESILRRTVNTL